MTRVAGTATAILLALLLVATGCGDDGPSAAEQRHDKAVAALAGGLQDNSDTGDGKGPVITDKEADCAGTALVDKVGVDALVDQRVLDDNLELVALPEKPSRKFARGTVHAISDCVGLVDYAVRTMRSLLRGLAKAGGTTKAFDDRDKSWARVLTCAKRRVPEKKARKVALAHPSKSLLPRGLLAKMKGCTGSVLRS